MSLHSEAAALLLVWAANLIKLYACVRKFGEFDQANNVSLNATVLNLDEV